MCGVSGTSLCGERDGEQRDRHSDKSCTSGSWTFTSCSGGNANGFGITSEEGETDAGFSKRVESFRSPSRSAKSTKNGSSVSMLGAGASGTEEEEEEEGVGERGTCAGGGVCTGEGG